MMYASVLHSLPMKTGKYKAIVEVGPTATTIHERTVIFKANYTGWQVGDWQQVIAWKFINT